jgi:endonuclease YncB( thermonuclease family)
MKGKFGRILGDFILDDGRKVTEVLIDEGHAVAYFGGSKDDVDAAHLVNRDRLIAEGVVVL